MTLSQKYKVALAFLAFLLSFALGGCFDSSKWYDYGNGKINLANVNFIKPTLEATLTLPNDPTNEIGSRFTEALNEQNINKYKGFLSTEKILTGSFYAIKLSSHIMFDSFKLELFQTKLFIKRPDEYTVNEFMIKKMNEQNMPKEIIEAMKISGKEKKFDRNAFESMLRSVNVNLENYWVKSVLVNSGLGEKGFAFIEKFGIESKPGEVVATDSDLLTVKSQLDDALSSYRKLPAK